MDEATGEGSSPNETDVTVQVKEKNWYYLQTGATTTGTQPSLDASEFSSLRWVDGWVSRWIDGSVGRPMGGWVGLRVMGGVGVCLSDRFLVVCREG